MRDKQAKTIINEKLVQEMRQARQKNSVYGIVCSVTPDIHHLRLYATKELARAKLKKLADERRHNLGVHWHEETEDMFFYTLGWEESPVRFSIIELNVEN